MNSAFNERIAAALERDGLEVFVPQRLCPEELPHESYSHAIYRGCLQAMLACDVGLLTGDCYGHDSAWECGWFASRGRPMICLVTASLRILEDWMLKGGLRGVVTTDPAFAERFRRDEILGRVNVYLIGGLGELGQVIRAQGAPITPNRVTLADTDL